MRPPKEAGSSEGYLWELKVALQKCEDILQQLGMTQYKRDPALFYRKNYRERGKLDSMIATHADKFIHAGTIGFDDEVIEKLENLFQMKTRAWNIMYTGFRIGQNTHTLEITIDQEEYVSKIGRLRIGSESRAQIHDKTTSNEETGCGRQSGSSDS